MTHTHKGEPKKDQIILNQVSHAERGADILQHNYINPKYINGNQNVAQQTYLRTFPFFLLFQLSVTFPLKQTFVLRVAPSLSLCSPKTLFYNSQASFSSKLKKSPLTARIFPCNVSLLGYLPQNHPSHATLSYQLPKAPQSGLKCTPKMNKKKLGQK